MQKYLALLGRHHLSESPLNTRALTALIIALEVSVLEYVSGVGFFVSCSNHSSDLISIHITKSFYGLDTGNYL